MKPETLAALIEQAPDAMILSDHDGVIRLWNAAATTLFGHSAADALGRSLDLIIPAHLRAGHAAGFTRALATGEEKYRGRVMTTRALHANGGKVYVDLSFALIRDGAGDILGVLACARVNQARPAHTTGSVQAAPGL